MAAYLQDRITHVDVYCNPLRGNKFLKLFTTVLVIAAAGGAAYYAKQEMDRSQTSPRGSPEILIVDDKIDSETIASASE